MSGPRRGVYPGSFDPLTVAHLAIAEAAVRVADLDRIDLVLSNVALGKERDAQAHVERRADAIRRASRARPWLGVTITDAQLIADIAAGYDVVVMGADKWAQVRDPHWYGGDVVARDAALAALPRVLVVPRPGSDVADAETLDIDPDLAHISSSRARAGEHHLIPPDTRRTLLVDGNNVMGSRPDGWWRDRAGAQRRLARELDALAARTGDRVTVVFDGAPQRGGPELPDQQVRISYARRSGRDGADDRIIEEVERSDDPTQLTVVTSDGELGRRARALGANVESVGTLTRELGWEHR